MALFWQLSLESAEEKKACYDVSLNLALFPNVKTLQISTETEKWRQYFSGPFPFCCAHWRFSFQFSSAVLTSIQLLSLSCCCGRRLRRYHCRRHRNRHRYPWMPFYTRATFACIRFVWAVQQACWSKKYYRNYQKHLRRKSEFDVRSISHTYKNFSIVPSILKQILLMW